MPYADSDGVRIHYRVEGSGPPLVLNHWSLGSSRGWSEYGFVNRLKDSFTVIAHDVRGHGMSAKPVDPKAYSLDLRVKDVIAVLDDLGVERSLFYGYSMGGWIGFGAARLAADRFRAVAIGGAHPYAQSMAGLRELLRIGADRGAKSFIEQMEGSVEDFLGVHEAEWITADFAAQCAAALDRESMEETLPTIDCPCLIVAGTEDPVFAQAKRAGREIPCARFEPLAGLDHGSALMRSDVVVPLLREFFRREGMAF